MKLSIQSIVALKMFLLLSILFIIFPLLTLGIWETISPRTYEIGTDDRLEKGSKPIPGSRREDFSSFKKMFSSVAEER